VPKRITLKQIAQEVGVSVMTVSRALNNRENVDQNTRQRILKTAKRLGYRPNHIAKSLVLRKTFTIGVVIPEITHSFFPEVIRGIEEVSYNAGYQLILTHSAEDFEREKKAILTLETKRVDGILISTAETVQDFSLYQEFLEFNFPMVFFDRCVNGIGATCVSINDEESAYMITRHLIEHGYKKIAHLSGPAKVSIGLARLNGFRRALQESGIEVKEEWIVGSGFHESGGYTAMQSLLNRSPQDRPRAVVAVNDPAAFGAMQAIQEANLRIPEDIAIVGFSDDIRAPLMPTPLTTIRQPAYEVGKISAQKLLDIIEGRQKEPQEIVIPTRIIFRRSCGCSG